jgi:hypothetical protein
MLKSIQLDCGKCINGYECFKIKRKFKKIILLEICCWWEKFVEKNVNIWRAENIGEYCFEYVWNISGASSSTACEEIRNSNVESMQQVSEMQINTVATHDRYFLSKTQDRYISERLEKMLDEEKQQASLFKFVQFYSLY